MVITGVITVAVIDFDSGLLNVASKDCLVLQTPHHQEQQGR